MGWIRLRRASLKTLCRSANRSHRFAERRAVARSRWVTMIVLAAVIGLDAGSRPCVAQSCDAPVTTITRYVDCSSATNGDGTLNNKWNSLKTLRPQRSR